MNCTNCTFCLLCFVISSKSNSIKSSVIPHHKCIKQLFGKTPSWCSHKKEISVDYRRNGNIAKLFQISSANGLSPFLLSLSLLYIYHISSKSEEIKYLHVCLSLYLHYHCQFGLATLPIFQQIASWKFSKSIKHCGQ